MSLKLETFLKEGEKAKAIPGTEGFYFATNQGRIFSCKVPGWRGRKGYWRELSYEIDHDGYKKVALSCEPKKTPFVHRLVLETFVGPCPEGLQCRHFDGVPDNCNLENLEWNTQSVNQRDRDRHGTRNSRSEKLLASSRINVVKARKCKSPVVSEETKKRMREVGARPEVKAKRSKAQKEAQNRPEVREKKSKALLGRKYSEDRRKKICEMHNQIINSAWIKKEEAWKPLPEEKNIPIDYSEWTLEFTRRWFRNRNQCTYSTFLPEKFTGEDPVNMIQIGVFEGMDLVWSLQNLLNHPMSRVIAIDPWLKTSKLSQEDMDQVYERACRNLEYWDDRIEIVRGFSGEVLKGLSRSGVRADIRGKEIRPGDWDFIIIDGDHQKDAVYEDAVNSFNLIKPGGWILFDDVRQNRFKPGEVPDGLEQFLKEFGDGLEFIVAHRFVNIYEKKSC